MEEGSGQFDSGTRILRAIHGRDAPATLQTDLLLGKRMWM